MFKIAEATTESREDAIELIIDTEFPSALIEDVEFLSRKVQQGLSFEAALPVLKACGGQIGPEEKSVIAGACERWHDLERLSDDEIQDIARAVKLNIEVKEKERLQLEDQRLFHAPAMAADFEHYRRLAYWDMHEATCLLLGKDPRRLKQTFLLNSPGGLPFAVQFRELTDIMTRAAEAGLIGDEWRIEPARLVPWALRTGIDVPEALATAFRLPDTEPPQDLSHDLQSSRAELGGSSNRMGTAMSYAELEKKVSDLETKLRLEKGANTRWRKTTLLIIYGLLHGTFRGSPREKPASVSAVVGFIDQALGRQIDCNTIRSRIKEISEELQRDIDQQRKQDEAGKKRN